MTLVRRRIDVTITLGAGEFGEDVGDTVTLTGHRVVAEMAAVGGDAQGQIQLRIYGLPLATINRLTSIGPIATEIRGKNRVMVAAGDDGSALSTIFEGTIDQAYGDFQSAPDVALNINALSALGAAVKPVGASSYKGSIDAAVVLANLAELMGFAFENNDVSVQLSNPYFPGTALDQVKACARAANIRYTIDRNILAIWPKNGVRQGEVPIVSPATGLVGYPVFSSAGLGVTSIFQPSVRQGGQIEVVSSLGVACGVWNIFNVLHRLESERPNGPWFTFMNCYRAPT